METSLVIINNNNIELTEKASLTLSMILKQETEIKMFKERLKEEMVDAMEKTNRKTYEDDNIRIIYKKGSTRTTIDSKRLKEEQPTIFDEYSKTSETKASISMELK